MNTELEEAVREADTDMWVKQAFRIHLRKTDNYHWVKMIIKYEYVWVVLQREERRIIKMEVPNYKFTR